MTSSEQAEKVPPWETDEYRARQELMKARWDKHRARANTFGFVVFLPVFVLGAGNGAHWWGAVFGAALGWGARCLWFECLPAPKYECPFCFTKVKPKTQVCPSCTKDIASQIPEA